MSHSGPSAVAITLSEAERAELMRRTKMPHRRSAEKARIVLACADGMWIVMAPTCSGRRAPGIGDPRADHQRLGRPGWRSTRGECDDDGQAVAYLHGSTPSAVRFTRLRPSSDTTPRRGSRSAVTTLITSLAQAALILRLARTRYWSTPWQTANAG